jgi:hypothetical protein
MQPLQQPRAFEPLALRGLSGQSFGLRIWEAVVFIMDIARLVDRKDRRDKSLLRIGRLWLKAILKKANRDLSPATRNWVAAQLTNCFPFSHRKKCLYFSIYLQ